MSSYYSGIVNGIDAEDYIEMIDAVREVKNLKEELEDSEKYTEELEEEIIKLKKEIIKHHLNDWRFGDTTWSEEEMTDRNCERAINSSKRGYLESLSIPNELIKETVIEEYRARLIEAKIEEVKENGTAE